jgi:hypothetical protein
MGKNVDKSTSRAQPVVTPQHAPVAPGNGTGSALFVINLCASIAPVRLDGNNIPGLENYRLYQVARNEDGRTRHRLRLGFFTSEKHAESVLTVVRQQYPTAFTACLCEEDRRFARGYLPEAAAAPPKPVAAQPKPVAAQPAAPKPGAAPPAAKQAPAPAPANKPATKQAPPAVNKPAAADSEVIELTWEPETPAKATSAKAASPAPAAKSAVASTDGLDEFTWAPPSLTPAADAAIAKSTASGVLKAKPGPEKPAAEKSTSDTAKHPALKTSDTAKHPAPKVAAKPPAVKPATPAVAKPAAAPVAAKPAAPKPAAPVAAKPAAPIAQEPATPHAAPAIKPDTASSMRVRTLDLTFSDPPPAPVETPRTAPAAPFHVGKGVQVKDSGISLAADAPAATKPATHAKPNVDKPVVATKQIAPPAKSTAPALPPAARATGLPSTPPPELDSTQTIRALTNAEMEDAQQDKWFAVQLAVSDQPVNLDAMPRLDIFEAYRLYSVATAGSGKIVHSLRLGFFKEAVSAEAVMGYLQTFFGSPSVMRVSVAEHARFKDAPSTKKPPAPAHEAKVVELNNARATRPVVPTVTMEVATGVDAAATGSFKLNDSGSFKMNATGAHKALATGAHKALKSAAKAAGPKTKSAPRTAQTSRSANTGKHRTLPASEKKSLAEELLDEAREVELSESGIRKLPKNDSLLSRMLGKLTK